MKQKPVKQLYFDKTPLDLKPVKQANGNMYDFISKTWNPLAGTCQHRCGYCYVERMKKRMPQIMAKYSGEYRMDETAMKKKFKAGENVFVCSCNDLFEQSVPREFIMKIQIHCCKFPDTNFLFQTKNPDGFITFQHTMPKNTILCTTIESNYMNMVESAPLPIDRAIAMSKITGFEKQVTIEPIQWFKLMPFVEMIRLTGASQINVGADSGHNHLMEPKKSEVLALIAELEKFTTVKIKSNLKRIIG